MYPQANGKEPWGARVPKVEAEKLRIRDILEKRAGKPAASLPPEDMPLRATAGWPCPRAGTWEAQDVTRPDKRFYKEGEIMADSHAAYGWTVWHWVG